MLSPILTKFVPITFTFNLTSGVCTSNVSEARYRRIEQIVQRDFSNQRKNSLQQKPQDNHLQALVPCCHIQSVVKTVNDES